MSETGFDEDSPPVEIRYVRDGLWWGRALVRTLFRLRTGMWALVRTLFRLRAGMLETGFGEDSPPD